MVALYVASHYRNTPNDLLLMADAPAHHLFVLLGPHDPTVNAIPDIIAVVQVSASLKSAQNSSKIATEANFQGLDTSSCVFLYGILAGVQASGTVAAQSYEI